MLFTATFFGPPINTRAGVEPEQSHLCHKAPPHPSTQRSQDAEAEHNQHQEVLRRLFPEAVLSNVSSDTPEKECKWGRSHDVWQHGEGVFSFMNPLKHQTNEILPAPKES